MRGGGRLDMHSAVYRDEAGSIPVCRARSSIAVGETETDQPHKLRYIGFNSRGRNQLHAEGSTGVRRGLISPGELPD